VGLDECEQVAVAVDETAVDPGGTGDGGGADLDAVAGGVLEGCDYPLVSAG
jgi:hypothetical protein